MSFLKASLNGKTVYSSRGEELRGTDLRCYMCGAKMILRHFPLSEDYYFALNKGERHDKACNSIEEMSDCYQPVIDKTIDELIANLSKDTSKTSDKSYNGTKTDRNSDESNNKRNQKHITNLRDIIKFGTYFENPYEDTFENSGTKFIDCIIFDKWAGNIWTNSLVNIGSRIVEARWAGSFKYPGKQAITNAMRQNKQIWFSMFWNVGGSYKCIRFCLDCSICFPRIKEKLFEGAARKDGSYDDFYPKKGSDESEEEPKLDVLIGARWVKMSEDQCRESCPFKMCKGCLGAYWGKCSSPKQIEAFPTDKVTKDSIAK